MTRRHLLPLRMLLVAADWCAATFVFLAVSAVRFDSDPVAQWSIGIDVGTAAVLFATTWVVASLVIGLYRLRVRWSFLAEARDILRGSLLVLAVSLSALFLLHQDDVSRLLLAMLFVTQAAVTLVGRLAVRRWFESRRRRGKDKSYMLVVGENAHARAFADEIERHPALGIRVIGHLTAHGEPATDEQPPARPVLGAVAEIQSVFRSQVVDEVAICLPQGSADLLEPIVAIAAEEGKTVRVPRAAEDGMLADALREEFGGFLVHSIVHDGHRDVERAFKRLVDVVGSAIALVILSPVMLAAALAVRVGDGSPVLFRQTRIGRHGRPFTLLKFRTMVVGAEDQLPALIERNEVNGPAFKIRDDPRVTRVGRFLRRTSIDELPQLWNVLLGDMSLVGPRPALPHEVEAYDIWHRRRLSVRPGMTGLWQIEARMEPEFDSRVQLDLRYIDQWSLWMDLRILLRTVPAVLLRSGQ